MAISDEVQNLQTNLENSYTAVSNKGGTLPQDQCFDNLPSAINSISTGGTINSLNVTPTTSAQTITASGGVDGFNPVNVSAVDASIDSNIQPNNILDGVTILGVTGNVEELNATSQTVTPTTSQQTITPSSPYNAFDSVTVNAVTSAIDSDIQAGNIKSGVNILGVNGTVVELNGETKSVSLTSANGQTFTPSSNKNAITSITVTPNNQARTVTPTTSQQTLTVNSGYSGNGTVTVNAVTSAIDSSIQPENIKKDVVILGTTGTYEGSGGVGITREVSATGVFQMPASSFTFTLPSNATDVGRYAMFYAFRGSTSLTTVDLSNLTTVSGYYAMNATFDNCANLTTADLSSLTTVSGEYAIGGLFNVCTSLTSVDLSSLTTLSGQNGMRSTFTGCTSLTSVDLSSLTTVSGQNAMYQAFYACASLTSLNLSSLTTVSGQNAMQQAFGSCTGLTNVNFNNLQTIGINSSTQNYGQFSQCFMNCTNLTSITFPKLEKIYCTGSSPTYGTFYNNTSVQKMYFPKLDTITYGKYASAPYQVACKNIFSGCSALTELHFGAANQAAIEASPGYSTAWGRGAGNVTIYFDL